MNKDRTPRLVTPLRYEYLMVGKVIQDNNIFSMTEQEFIGACMKVSGGQLNPNRVKELYHIFMEDAGLEPLYDKSTLCDSKNPSMMCKDCNCWKHTREMCS
jgi:hypothetical protein